MKWCWVLLCFKPIFFQVCFASADNEVAFTCSFEGEGDVSDVMCHNNYDALYSDRPWEASDPEHAALRPYDGNRYAVMKQSEKEVTKA